MIPAITGEIPIKYYGLRAIAKRLDVDTATVLNWAIKRNLPIIQMTCSRKLSYYGWRWYIDETLLALWFIEEYRLYSRPHLLRTRTGRANTVRERSKRRGRPIPAHLEQGATIGATTILANTKPQ